VGGTGLDEQLLSLMSTDIYAQKNFNPFLKKNSLKEKDKSLMA
jgi:hypothetical protein